MVGEGVAMKAEDQAPMHFSDENGFAFKAVECYTLDTLKLDKDTPLKLFESIESPRVDGDNEHQSWLQQSRYQAWIGERNLHID